MRLMRYITLEPDSPTEPVNALFMDGYWFSDRQLEGLPIKIELTPSGDDITISADWPRGFEKAYWTQKAKEYALIHDHFSTTVDLEDDGGFISQESP